MNTCEHLAEGWTLSLTKRSWGQSDVGGWPLHFRGFRVSLIAQLRLLTTRSGSCWMQRSPQVADGFHLIWDGLGIHSEAEWGVICRRLPHKDNYIDNSLLLLIQSCILGRFWLQMTGSPGAWCDQLPCSYVCYRFSSVGGDTCVAQPPKRTAALEWQRLIRGELNFVWVILMVIGMAARQLATACWVNSTSPTYWFQDVMIVCIVFSHGFLRQQIVGHLNCRNPGSSPAILRDANISSEGWPPCHAHELPMARPWPRFCGSKFWTILRSWRQPFLRWRVLCGVIPHGQLEKKITSCRNIASCKSFQRQHYTQDTSQESGGAAEDICAVAPDNIHQTWYALKACGDGCRVRRYCSGGDRSRLMKTTRVVTTCAKASLLEVDPNVSAIYIYNLYMYYI